MLTFEMGALLRKRYDDFLGPYYDAGERNNTFYYIFQCSLIVKLPAENDLVRVVPDNSALS